MMCLSRTATATRPFPLPFSSCNLETTKARESLLKEYAASGLDPNRDYRSDQMTLQVQAAQGVPTDTRQGTS